MQNYIFPGQIVETLPDFPHAPPEWTTDFAQSVANTEKLALSEIHWQVIQSLQDYFDRQEDAEINLRELHDALDEHFHAQGGLKHLYEIFPGGPVAQGCRLAGLEIPHGAVNPSLGSVM